MVTTLNITLDDDTADRARAVKDAMGLTWAEFIVAATETFEAQTEQERKATELGD